MKQSMHFLTLGVENLERMKEFYTQQFGWTLMLEQGDIIFFKLNGFILSLYPADALADDAGVPQDGKGFKRFTMAINFQSEEEVNKAVEELRGKGVNILKEAQKVFWGGYHAYVSDPENNYWELAYNPFLELDTEDRVSGH